MPDAITILFFYAQVAESRRGDEPRWTCGVTGLLGLHFRGISGYDVMVLYTQTYVQNGLNYEIGIGEQDSKSLSTVHA